MFKLGLMLVGIIAIVISVFRHVARRRQFGDSYKQYIDEVKLRHPMDSNEFGQKVKWIVDNDDTTEEPTQGGSESPTGSGG